MSAVKTLNAKINFKAHCSWDCEAGPLACNSFKQGIT